MGEFMRGTLVPAIAKGKAAQALPPVPGKKQDSSNVATPAKPSSAVLQLTGNHASTAEIERRRKLGAGASGTKLLLGD